MMPRTLLVAAILAVAPPLFAQSLADAARKAEEERSAKKATPTKVYSNKDLKDVPSSVSPAATPTPTGTTAQSVAIKSERDEVTRAAEYREVARKDEAYWKARMSELQSALDTDQIRLTAMENRVASLSADFGHTDSVTQRAVLGREREQAVTEVSRLKAAVLADAKAISTAEEEARRANVPPGWLRP